MMAAQRMVGKTMKTKAQKYAALLFAWWLRGEKRVGRGRTGALGLAAVSKCAGEGEVGRYKREHG